MRFLVILGVLSLILIAIPISTATVLIEIDEPKDGEEVYTETITVKGKAYTTAPGAAIEEVRVNGKLAEGTTFWSAVISLEPGLNVIEVVAKDNVGNSATKTISVTYVKPTLTPTPTPTPTQTLTPTLTPAPTRATLIISSTPPEADVYINDRHVGQTPLKITVKEDYYCIKITKSGYQEYKKCMYVSTGQTLYIDAVLLPITYTPIQTKVPTPTTPNNIPPVANAGEDQTVYEGVPVTLTASASYDPDGKIVSYIWTENGVTISNDITFTKVFSLGTHVITLTVIDDKGAKSTDDVIIKVLKKPEYPKPSIVVSQKIIKKDIRIGSEVILYVTIKNIGNGKALNVHIVERVPDSISVSYVIGAEISGAIISWSGNLGPGDSHTIKHNLIPYEIGKIPISVTVNYEDLQGKKYTHSTDVYINVTSPTPTPTSTPSPSQTPSPSLGSPGFEAVLPIVVIILTGLIVWKMKSRR